MLLSRKWLNEFVSLPVSEVGDHDFAEAMTISGSKVEVTTNPGAEIKNVVVGIVKEIVRHQNSDLIFYFKEKKREEIYNGSRSGYDKLPLYNLRSAGKSRFLCAEGVQTDISPSGLG